MVIDRVTARCGAEYEWGVHIAYFAPRVALDDAQVRSIATGSPDATWQALELRDEQRLDLLLLAGWYHAISYVARAVRVPLEGGAPRFADYARPTD